MKWQQAPAVSTQAWWVSFLTVQHSNRCSVCKRQAEEIFPINRESVKCQGLGCLYTEGSAGISPSRAFLWPVWGSSWTPSAGGKGPLLVSDLMSLLEQEYHKGRNLLGILLCSLREEYNKTTAPSLPFWSETLSSLQRTFDPAGRNLTCLTRRP